MKSKKNLFTLTFYSFFWAVITMLGFGLGLVLISLLLGEIVEERPQKNSVSTSIDMAIWEAAPGRQPFFNVARAYEEEHREQIKINVSISPNIDNLVKPRILMGHPPEIVNSGLNIFHLLKNEKIYFLDSLLDTPSYDQPEKTWRETFLPGALDPFQYEGKVYAVPYNYLIWGLWYDQKLFREHGWTVPETWDELITLCTRIKNESDISPFAYQGKDIGFAYWFIMSLVQRIGGLSAIDKLNNIEEGAFTQPAFLSAVEMVQFLAQNYFQTGWQAMGRLEGQLQFINRRCALLICGTWLTNEIREVIPYDFELSFFPVPTIQEGIGEKTVHNSIWGGSTVIMKESNHPERGADILRFWISRKTMRHFSAETQSFSSIKDGTDINRLSAVEKQIFKVIQATTGTFTDRLLGLYPTWMSVYFNPSLINVLEGKMSVNDFGHFLEKTVKEKVKDNKNIYKPPPIIRKKG